MHIYALEKSLIIGPKFCSPPPPPAHPYTWATLLKIESLHPWVHGKPPMETEVDWSNTFWARLVTDTHTHTHGRTHTKWSQQERPLGQQKTLPANKLHDVTPRLMSICHYYEIYIYRILLFYHSIPEWPWRWSFKVTQGQIYWCP